MLCRGEGQYGRPISTERPYWRRSSRTERLMLLLQRVGGSIKLPIGFGVLVRLVSGLGGLIMLQGIVLLGTVRGLVPGSFDRFHFLRDVGRLLFVVFVLYFSFSFVPNSGFLVLVSNFVAVSGFFALILQTMFVFVP